MPEAQSGPVTRQQLDPHARGGRPSPASIARFIARAVAVLVGLGMGFYGVAFYLLRCFSTCPTDPAENAISQILPLSLLALAAAIIIAALTIGTRATATGTWIITGLGALMPMGGVATLLLVPSLRSPGDHSGIVALGLLDVAVGASLIVLARWVRRRREKTR